MGEDKSSVIIKQKTLTQYMFNLLINSNIKHIIISGTKIGLRDIKVNYGPLGGLYTILEYIIFYKLNINTIIILPIDMPLLSNNILKHLIYKHSSDIYDCTYYKSHFFPLILNINKKIIKILRNIIYNKKTCSLKCFIDKLNFNEILKNKQNINHFLNVNSKKELEIIKKYI